MNVCRPVFFVKIAVVSFRVVTYECDVVAEGINPYINNMLFVECYGDSPVEGCS
ncbi:hypothetical protein DSECCO2_600840 [anaerobic digester metagenome]